jgi:phosphoglycerate dehydrogenase-like enzyme
MQKLIDAAHQVVDYSFADMGSGTSENEVYEAVKDTDIAIAGLEPYRKRLIDKCPRLKMISRRGVGYDTIDVETCKANGITLARTVGAVEGSVAEHVMAYILYFSRRLDLQNQIMQSGGWKRILMPGAKSRTLGLVGFGGIGKEIAKRALPFGMKIVYYCRHPKKEWETAYGVTYVELDELLSASDYVSVNIPLTASTRGMFDLTMFQKMKKGSYFINIARGPIIDPHALKTVLDHHHLAGAGIDVFDSEPCTDSPLIGCSNAVLTPHTAPYTEENFTEMNENAAQNVLDYLAGKLPEKNRVV